MSVAERLFFDGITPVLERLFGKQREKV